MKHFLLFCSILLPLWSVTFGGIPETPIRPAAGNEAVFVGTIEELLAYAGEESTVTVTDPLRGGTFEKVGTELTNDNGIVFGSADGQHWKRIGPTSTANAAWFGVSSALEDNSALLNSAIKSPYVSELHVGQQASDVILVRQFWAVEGVENKVIVIDGILKKADVSVHRLTADTPAGGHDYYLDNASDLFKVGDVVGVDDDRMPVQGGGTGQTNHQFNAGRITAVYDNYVTIDSAGKQPAGVASNAVIFRSNTVMVIENSTNIRVTGNLIDGNKQHSYDGEGMTSYTEYFRTDDCIDILNSRMVTIENITLANGNLHALKIALESENVKNVTARDCHNKNIIVHFGARHIRFEDCISENSDFEDGISIGGDSRAGFVEDVLVTNMITRNNGRSGYRAQYHIGGQGGNVSFVNCQSVNDGDGAWIIGLNGGTIFSNLIVKSPRGWRHNPAQVIYGIKYRDSKNFVHDGVTFDGIGAAFSFIHLERDTAATLKNTVFKDLPVGNPASCSVFGTANTTIDTKLVNTTYINVDSTKIYRRLTLNFGNTPKSNIRIALDKPDFVKRTVLRYIDPIEQKITFAPLANRIYGAAPFTLQATSTNPAAPIAYSSNDTTVAAVRGNQLFVKLPGTVTITAFQNANGEFAAASVNQNLTIDKALLTIAVDNKTKLYGSELPEFTVQYTGFVNGEGVAVLKRLPKPYTTADKNSPVGSYSILCYSAAADNYNFKYSYAKLKVDKAPLLISARNVSKTYGDDLPQLELDYTGFVNADNPANLSAQPVVKATATKASPAGNYAIQVSGAASANYLITYKSGSLIVNKAILDIVSDNFSRIYGEPNPVFTINYQGFVNGESASVLTRLPVPYTTATETTTAGSYNILIKSASAVNYEFRYTYGKLTIAKAPLRIVADDKERFVGEANPALTATYEGFVNGESASVLTALPVLATSATVSSRAGRYAITLKSASAKNYLITYVAGVLTVKPNPALRLSGDSLEVGAVAFEMEKTSSMSVDNDSDVRIFPNPAAEFLTIDVKASSATSVRIYDGRGVRILEKAFLPGDAMIQLPVKNLAKGLYYLTLQKDQTFSTYKFLKD